MTTVEVFHGALTQTSAAVYAQCPELPGGAEWVLSGTVRGPHCPGVRTLPSTARLVDQGPGPTLLARATVLDPSLWSADLPASYKVEIELRRSGELVETIQRTLGLRQLGVSGRDLRWQSRRWVLRGVRREEATVEEVAVARQQRCCLVMSDPTEPLLAAASAAGVLVAICAEPPGLRDAVRCWSEFPAVALLVMPGDADVTAELNETAPNLLRAARLTPAPATTVPDWADLAFCDASDATSLKQFASACRLPIVAVRQLSQPTSLAAARTACDHLQRDLAPWGDFAGYLV